MQPPPDAVPGWLMPVNIAWQAVAAGYVGLFGLVVVVLFPFSLGLGIWGLRVIGKGTAKGRGRCWFAIASGVWNLVFFGLVLASYE